MITENNPRFLCLHPVFLKVIQGDERKFRAKIAAGLPACLAETPPALKEPIEQMLSAFADMLIGRVFEDLIDSFELISGVIERHEIKACKPTDVN